MNHIKLIHLLICLSIVQVVHSQTVQDTTKNRPIGYKDTNKDGINDLFCDTNGDGINDVTNKPYPHHFKFEDNDKNGTNDLWIDRDGDGVNDLMMLLLKKYGLAEIPWVDKDGDGIQDTNVKPQYNMDLSQFVLNADQGGKNDVTGLEINNNNVMGYRYGFIDEEMNQEIKKFVDKNGDGMYDKFSRRLMTDLERGYGRGRMYDYFIDKDGDGIADDRGFERRGNRMTGQSHGKKKGR